MNIYLTTLTEKYKATKFVKIVGDHCIPDYPDKNLPTLLIYSNSDLQQQLVGLSKLGGMNMTLYSLFPFQL
jgi:hypothetical protein